MSVRAARVTERQACARITENQSAIDRADDDRDYRDQGEPRRVSAQLGATGRPSAGG